MKTLKKLSVSLIILSVFLSLCCAKKAIEKKEPRLLLVTQNGKYGYIDETGRIVIEPQYDWAQDFSEGLAVVNKDDFYFYINTKGEIAFTPFFQYVLWDFSEGLAPVAEQVGYDRIPGIFGYIDKQGKTAIELQFQALFEPGSFREGYAYVQREKYGPYGYIDKTGTMVIEPKYDFAIDFSEGLASVKLNKKYGFIDPTGKEAIPIQFWLAGSFSEGLALVKLEEGGKHGFIDKTGAVVIPPQFDDVRELSEGLASVKLEENGSWGYIDTTGKVVIEAQFSEASKFSEGLAVVAKENLGKYGYIDKAGKIIIEPQFTRAHEFRGGIARVEIGIGIGYIDKTGKYIWQPTE